MFSEYTNPVNKGLEGLTWDGNNQNLFAAKEMKDVTITRANMISNDMGIDKIIDPVAKSLKDVSGLHYHTPTSSLLILSHESPKIIEVNNEGRITDRLYLESGWFGLTESVPQAEGITLDYNGYLYIVSEPNLFYRFAK